MEVSDYFMARREPSANRYDTNQELKHRSASLCVPLKVEVNTKMFDGQLIVEWNHLPVSEG